MNNKNISENITDLSQILVSTGVLTSEQMQLVNDIKDLNKNIPISQIIKNLQISDEVSINKMISKVLDSEYEIKSNYFVENEDYLRTSSFTLTQEVSQERKQLVVNYNEKLKTIDIIASDLLDLDGFTKTEKHFLALDFKKINFIIIPHLTFMVAHNKVYLNTDGYKAKVFQIINREESIQDNIKKIANLIIEQGVIENASDILIQENKDSLYSYIYFRIKRVKKYKYCFGTTIMHNLLQYLKQEGNMEAGKLNGHQDGSIAINILDNQYHVSIRINTISTVTGSQMAMRLQPEEQRKIETLGFEADDIEYIKTKLKKLKGIVLLLGITGSGKTTTIHSLLQEFNVDEYNIVTMEDPVEIRKRGLNQIEINKDAGQSFKDSIRAVLRQAPDILFLGEIRDAETAERAIEATNTGHMVMSTLHVGSIDAIEERLKELGIERTSLFMNNMSFAIYQELNPSKYGMEKQLCYEISRDDLNINKRVRLD